MEDDRANILREMKVCRFCLSSEEKELTNIYDKHSMDTKHSVPLPLQIMACIAIEVCKLTKFGLYIRKVCFILDEL